MNYKRLLFLLGLLSLLVLSLAACGGTDEAAETVEDTPATATDEPMDEPMDEPAAETTTMGLIMVGPRDDRGWNQAHWEAVEYVMEKNPNTDLVWFDKLNPADNPDLTVEQVVDDLVAQGADIIFTNSAEMGDGTNNAALAHPDVSFVHISGDAVLTGAAPANVGNIMGEMEYGKMIAGCAAAMSSETGKISYLGPLIDAETRRLVNSAYMGARYCWENYKGGDPADLEFNVTWIGFWFNIPGVTLDPTQVSNDFIDNGADVIISGIDTTEGLVVSRQRAAAGDNVAAIPYDFIGSCEEAPDVCLGVPYFNWGPSYLETVNAVAAGTWTPDWLWLGPDWTDINNHDTSMIGWVNGAALSADAATAVDSFIAELAGGLNLYVGPLNYQDGSVYLADGEVATPEQIWYTEQLLEGVSGASN